MIRVPLLTVFPLSRQVWFWEPYFGCWSSFLPDNHVHSNCCPAAFSHSREDAHDEVMLGERTLWGGPDLPSFIPEVAGSHCHGWEFHSSLSHYPNNCAPFYGLGGFAFRFWIPPDSDYKCFPISYSPHHDSLALKCWSSLSARITTLQQWHCASSEHSWIYSLCITICMVCCESSHC